jgi:nitric oxide reductase large subunit
MSTLSALAIGALLSALAAIPIIALLLVILYVRERRAK